MKQINENVLSTGYNVENVHVLGGHSPPVDTEPPVQSLLLAGQPPRGIPAGVAAGPHPKLQHPHLAGRLQLTDLNVQLVYMRNTCTPSKTH